ncbi:MAG: radical SAM protein [Candidatus Aminicenantes bacterium]|nr:radical SAM protein [Candidatus Aminicenantes bacterium]NIM83218.1 radical SAM protein [Candidatus Aminicenantes bacterium]NIN24322.1 radical SAM protein [Candidatus Aminicenantes bacterium]NIN48081.1 radical SAM protein [Candidatus Aminicenantes bacterium]NIN90982.1 radical SAM protein [Candidatus Aminicenantes bacterium]
MKQKRRFNVNDFIQPDVNFSFLTFLYTNTCNAQCSHCCLSCGPDKNDKLSPEFLIENLSSFPGLNIGEFCITGGEPFLFLEEIEEILSFANSLGLKSYIGTNGFWGVSYSKAYNVLRKLYLSGLKVLLLSTDKYHQEFVSVDKIYNIVRAAEDIGIAVKITVNMTGKETENLLLIEKFNDFKCLISFKEPKLMGRARKNVNKEDLITVIPGDRASYWDINEKNIHAVCNQVKAPLITPDKRVWICCGIPANKYYYTNFNLNPLVLGNMNEKSLAAILKENEDNPMLKILISKGPVGLVRILEKVTGEKYNFRDKYYWACDLCCDILGNNRHVKQIELKGFF